MKCDRFMNTVIHDHELKIEMRVYRIAVSITMKRRRLFLKSSAQLTRLEKLL